MIKRPRIRCPYTLKILTDLSAVNDEHIFPHAIGGSKEYMVRVDEKTNSTLGSQVDAPFVNSPLIVMRRNEHGVKSRSGVPDWEMDGVDTDNGRAVNVRFSHAGSMEVRHKCPIEIDPSTGKGTIIVKQGESAQLIEELTEKYRKKGMTLEVMSIEPQLVQKVQSQLTIELDALIGGLAKIAYLAAFEFLGDDFLDDPLNAEWQKAIRATTSKEFSNAKIHGRPFGEGGIHKALLPPLAPHQHAVSVCHMDQSGPMVAVKLFGDDMLSLICRASDTSTYRLRPMEGRVAVCDSITRKITVEPFEDFFPRHTEIATTK